MRMIIMLKATAIHHSALIEMPVNIHRQKSKLSLNTQRLDLGHTFRAGPLQ